MWGRWGWGRGRLPSSSFPRLAGKVSMETAALVSPEIWGKTGSKKSPYSFIGRRQHSLAEKRGASGPVGPGKRVGVPMGSWGGAPRQCPSPAPPQSNPSSTLFLNLLLAQREACLLPHLLRCLLKLPPRYLSTTPVPPCSLAPLPLQPQPHLPLLTGAAPAQPPAPAPHYSLGERMRHGPGDSCWGVNQSVHSFSCSCPLPGESWGGGDPSECDP